MVKAIFQHTLLLITTTLINMVEKCIRVMIVRKWQHRSKRHLLSNAMEAVKRCNYDLLLDWYTILFLNIILPCFPSTSSSPITDYAMESYRLTFSNCKFIVKASQYLVKKIFSKTSCGSVSQNYIQLFGLTVRLPYVSLCPVARCHVSVSHQVIKSLPVVLYDTRDSDNRQSEFANALIQSGFLMTVHIQWCVRMERKMV